MPYMYGFTMFIIRTLHKNLTMKKEKEKDEPKSGRLELRIGADRKKAAEELAEKSDLSLSQYFRRLIDYAKSKGLKL